MIHVIGNAALDSVMRVERFPRAGETIVALGASEDLGGKGANQAIVAARCGAPVRLVAPIGDDAPGERIRSSLAREGVQTDGMTISPYGSDRCVITVDRDGENTILSLIDAARHFDPIAETRIEFVDRARRPRRHAGKSQAGRHARLSRSGEVEGRRDGSQSVADLCGSRTMTGPWSISCWSTAARRFELAGVGADEAARELCNKGAGAVVLTLGADGALFFAADETFRVAAPRVIAVDAVGAGDVFCGVLVAAKALGRNWRDALAAAAEAASISVTRNGVLASFPSREEMACILERAALKRLEESQQ